tara:strand:- start:640 stop:2040 length:1401 start_codon:yes stop_codon:yes gene_type:complete
VINLVQISFAEKTRSLPEDSELVKKKFVEYLGTTKDEEIRVFRDIIYNMLRVARRTDVLEETKQEVSKLIKEILEDESLSYEIYSADGEAFAEFLGRNPQERERREQLAKESSLFEIFTDDDLYLDMIGASGLKAGREYDVEDRIPRPRILGSGGFLDDEDLSEIDIEDPIIDIQIIVKDIPKKYKDMIKDAKKNAYEDKGSNFDKVDAEERSLKSLLLGTPDFISSITFDFRIDGNERRTAYIPEVEGVGKENVAEAMINHYVNDIRNLHNIRSGGFVPTGRYYTRETGSKTKEVKYVYSSIGTTKAEIDLSKNVVYGELLDNFLEQFQNLNLFETNDFLFEIDEFSIDITDLVEDSSFIKSAIQSLEVPNELKMYELYFTVSINKPKASEMKKAKTTGERNNIMKKALSNSRLNIDTRRMDLGKFDFSYYSKAGQVVSDKMGEHLEDIRVKLDWLESRGLDGGI